MASINYYSGINMVGSDVDFNKNEAVAIVIENTTAPSSPSTGQMYYDTGDNTMYYRNNSAWVEMDGSGSGVSQLTAGSGISLSATTGNITVTNSGVLSVNTTDGTFIDLTPNSSSTGAVVVTADLSAVDGTAGAGTRFLDKNNKWSVPAGAYTKWQYQTDGGTAIDMIDGEVLNFIGGTGITLADAAASPNTLTVTNAGVTSIVAGTGISVSGATGAVTVTNTVSNTTSLGIANSSASEQFKVTDTVDLQFAASGGASVAFDSTNKRVTYTAPSNTNTTYTLPTTNGANPDIVLTGSDSTTDVVNMNGTGGTVKVTGSGTNTIEFDLVDDVTIAGDLTVSGGDISLGGGTGRIQGIDTVSASTDAASKGYVDGLVTGGLTFKDGFNAGDGSIDGGGNLTTGASRVAISVGDYYVVTTGGSFYGSVTLDDGDSVICKKDAAAGTSDINDWVIVQSDEGVSQFSSNSMGGSSSGQAITSQTAAVGSVTVQSFAYNGGSNIGHVPSGGGSTTFLRGDATWVTPTNTNTTYTMDFTQDGNNVDMKLDGSAGTDTTMQFTASSNITLTRVSATEMSIASTDTTTNNYVDSLAWNTGNGILTVGRSGLSDLTVDLDGRYLEENETITLTGDVTGSGKTGIATTIAADAVHATMLNDDIISSQTAITTVAGSDEILISDAGVLKRADVSQLSDQVFKGNTYAGTLTSFGAVTHGLGTYDVIVQCMDATSYETIKVSVDRTGTNEVTIAGNSFPAGDIRVMVTAIAS
jgi:hypothetical protein